MCVLHVINRIFIGVSLQDIEIHNHRRINWIANQGVTRSVNANFFNKLFKSNDRAGALGKFYFFATFHDLYQLADQDMDVVFRVIASAGCSRLKAMDITVVICAEHIDTDIETAFALIYVISGI